MGRSVSKGLRSPIYHVVIASDFQVNYFYYGIIQHDVHISLTKILFCKIIKIFLINNASQTYVSFGDYEAKKAQHLLGWQPTDRVLFSLFIATWPAERSVVWPVDGQPAAEQPWTASFSCARRGLPSPGEALMGRVFTAVLSTAVL